VDARECNQQSVLDPTVAHRLCNQGYGAQRSSPCQTGPGGILTCRLIAITALWA
jgi:hypothetical protein